LSRNRIFEHAFIEFEKLERVTTDTSRYYVLPDGSRAWSVTQIIGQAMDKTPLLEWKARVGEAEAQKISTQAARRGTAFHSICESYLLNEESYPRNTMPVNIDAFKKIRPFLNEHIGKIYGIEAMLYSTTLKAAGTTDCIAEWDGVMSIIDFKTSRKTKREEWIESYFLQATTYALMMEERTGIKVPQIVILISVDNEDPQVFVKDKEPYIQRVKEIFS
jgi:CRISPR/Cas system-associated exonuclease Cas4 (RecB family)